jgi:hypothetical protein
MEIPAVKAARFSAAKEFKEALNTKKVWLDDRGLQGPLFRSLEASRSNLKESRSRMCLGDI